MDIEKLDFSVRTYNCLKRYGINTVGELIGRMGDIRRFAPKACREANEKIALLSEGKIDDDED